MKKAIIFTTLFLGACSQDPSNKCLDDQNWRPECTENDSEGVDSNSETETDSGNTNETSSVNVNDTTSDNTETDSGDSCGSCGTMGTNSSTSGEMTSSTTYTSDTGSTDTGETTETCSDSSSSDTTSTEEVPRCGDGNVDKGEECDDGNMEDGDGCSNSCEDTRHEICKNKDQIIDLWSAVRNSENQTAGNNCDGDPKCGTLTEDWSGQCGWYRFTGDAGDFMLRKVDEKTSCGGKYAGWHKGKLPASVSKTAIPGKICFAGNDILGNFNSCLFWSKTWVVKCEDGSFVYKLGTVPTHFCNAVHCGVEKL